MKKFIFSVCIIVGVILVFTSIILYGRYLLHNENQGIYNTQRIKGQEVISVSNSPDGTYTITAYLNNGGATTDFAVLCTVKNNKTGKERNIYWKYHCSTAFIKWMDDKTVKINGIELDVTKDTYDYRKDEAT